MHELNSINSCQNLMRDITTRVCDYVIYTTDCVYMVICGNTDIMLILTDLPPPPPSTAESVGADVGLMRLA